MRHEHFHPVSTFSKLTGFFEEESSETQLRTNNARLQRQWKL